MRTYEITLTVQQTVTRTITSEKEESHETLTAAALELEGVEATNLIRSRVFDRTPKPKTDKQRFNDAFRELRKLGYDARQGLSPLDDGPDVYTMREDAAWAFRGNGELVGMVPVNWDYELLDKDASGIVAAFERHGFDAEWSGRYFNAVLVRRGGEAK